MLLNKSLCLGSVLPLRRGVLQHPTESGSPSNPGTGEEKAPSQKSFIPAAPSHIQAAALHQDWATRATLRACCSPQAHPAPTGSRTGVSPCPQGHPHSLSAPVPLFAPFLTHRGTAMPSCKLWRGPIKLWGLLFFPTRTPWLLTAFGLNSLSFISKRKIIF